MDLKTVVDEVGSWPAEDRLRLIGEVWDSLAVHPEAIELTEAQKLDLQHRLDAYRNDPKAGSSWEEVKARLQANRK